MVSVGYTFSSNLGIYSVQKYFIAMDIVYLYQRW